MPQNWNQITSWLKKQTFSGKLLLILSFSMKLKSGSIWKRKLWTYFLTMISKNKLDMGPHLWVLDHLVIAPQEANSPGQNYYLNMLLANCFQCNQQASSTVNQMFQPFLPESIDSQNQLIQSICAPRSKHRFCLCHL